MEKFNWKGHGSMLAANVMWGVMSPVSKFVMLGGILSPLAVTDLRIGGAMILFWIASLFQKPEHVDHKDMGRLFVAALLGIVFNQGLFIFGVSLSTPGDASIITTSMPLWAMLLAALILKEPITSKKVLGIAAGACGALLLILGGHNAGSGGEGKDYAIVGDLLVLTAELCYALYLVLFKNFVAKYSLITIMKWMFTYSFICLLPFSANTLRNTAWAALSANEIAGTAYTVICGTFICYMLVVVGQKALRPTVAGMYNYIQPIVACCLAIWWGMDSFSWAKGLAILLIFGGVYLVSASPSREEMERQDGEETHANAAG